ncbi:hypothetical protein GCM10023321_73420 [Pseudonocardia eucalypti]|uniref:Uncharacterized protein n=1 Tax=Pseudonocardia eucalypti TaxID=648755 RepID=A0ABP9R8Y8_9PSEU
MIQVRIDHNAHAGAAARSGGSANASSPTRLISARPAARARHRNQPNNTTNTAPAMVAAHFSWDTNRAPAPGRAADSPPEPGRAGEADADELGRADGEAVGPGVCEPDADGRGVGEADGPGVGVAGGVGPGSGGRCGSTFTRCGYLIGISCLGRIRPGVRTWLRAYR